MTSMAEQQQQTTDVPVRKSITVKASPEHAFEVFTAGFDSWWPRGHHIGKSPMTRAIIEGRAGGRCYAEQADGTESDWGQVLTWDPPRRFVIAWQINLKWEYEPDLAKSSDVEFSFTPLGDGRTRVDLEHRHLSRHGAGFEEMRKGVDSPDGWGTLMELYAAKVEGR
jgi:uncharacterized protein YndB with AHSA1/START domain